MNRVLVIASGFPPQGGGGVTRIHSFVKYLPKFHWQPIVLTLTEEYAYSHAVDYSLLKEYDSSVEIVRTKSFEPSKMVGNTLKKQLTGFNKSSSSFSQRFFGPIKFLLEVFMIPDEKILWLIPCVIAARKIIRKNDINLIYLTTPPHSVSLIGSLISKIYKLPLVWDVRDDWIGNKYFESKFLHRSKLESLLESFAIKTADKIIVVTAESSELIAHKYPDLKMKIQLIPNGYDPDTIKSTADQKNAETKPTCKFIYSGSLTRRRNLEPFFEVIAELNRTGELINRLRIEFVGSLHQEQIEIIEKLRIENIVITHGHVSHRESIEKLNSADVCLLISTHDEGSQTVIPSKIYEYLASNKYIFALAEKDSAVAKLMEGQQFGIVVSPSSTNSIREGLLTTISAFNNGALNVNVSDEFINRYNRLLLTEKLAESFNRLITQ